MYAVARDFATVIQLGAERHGLCDGRRALFGVSFGTLLASFAFLRDGIGQRLLGTLGHADLFRFARSYTPSFVPWIFALPVRNLAKMLAYLTAQKWIPAGVDFLFVLNELRSEGELNALANPMQFIDRVGPERRVRFLVGQDDHLVKPDDARNCAGRFPDGDCYVVPGLGHGGSSFVENARTFLGTQLGDWRW